MVKNPPASAGDTGDSGSVHPSFSCLENPMNRGAWQATVHGLTESDMTDRLSTQEGNTPYLLTPFSDFFSGNYLFDWWSWEEGPSNSLWRNVAHRLLCPWDSPGKNTRAGCRALLQGIFPTQAWNLSLLRLLRYRRILYHWATREAHVEPRIFLISSLLGLVLTSLRCSPSSPARSEQHAFRQPLPPGLGIY